MAPTFERKCGLVVVTGRGELNLHRLAAACESSADESLNVHSLLGDIYTKMGDIIEAVNEYKQAIRQRTNDAFLDNRTSISGNTMILEYLSDVVRIAGKISQLLECLSDVNKNNPMEHNLP